MRRQAWLVAGMATLLLAQAACTEIVDTCKGLEPPLPAKCLPPGQDVADTAQPDGTVDTKVDSEPDAEPCTNESCGIQNRECFGNFCGECLPGYVENSSGLCVEDEDPCTPDPCAAEFRVCTPAGTCGGCIEGYADDGSGVCESLGDPCIPNPCANVNKQCVNGFCDQCLPGYVEDASGVCLPPNACNPNPCKEPLKTQCTLDNEGLPVCQCDVAAHPDGQGGCTFDPCVPNPCEAPFPACSFQGPVAICDCPSGQMKSEDEQSCVNDPCEPNPCTDYAKTVCALDAEDANGYACGCIQGWDDLNGDGACEETRVDNLEELPAPEGVVTIDDDLQLFVDEWLIKSREGLARRLHTAQLQTDAAPGGWAVGPDDIATTQIGRARANGSLVHVPESAREVLPDEHPLKAYPWRLYYMGYRAIWAGDAQTSWLCVAGAMDPAGPWDKPVIDEDSPAPHCVLQIDAMVEADVSLVNGQWSMSLSRQAIGSVATGGVFLFTSPDGVTWNDTLGGPYVHLSTSVVPPAAYARIGERSRVVRDTWNGQWFGLWSLPSSTLGDARGTQQGKGALTNGWSAAPDPLTAPAVLGPSVAETVAGLVYGDQTAWRMGSLWLGLLQKRLKDCPRTGYGTLVASRDGVSWSVVRDELDASNDQFLPLGTAAGALNTTVATLSGGRPGESGGLWHFYAGGVTADPCSDAQAPGGIFRATVRAGGVAGLEVQAGMSGKLETRVMKLKSGVTGAAMTLNANLSGSMLIQIEAVSPIGTIIDAVEKVVTAGDYVNQVLAMEDLSGVTGDLFRIRFQFLGGGELFGFAIGDPLCNPNPCVDDPLKQGCESIEGQAVCVCAPPLHDDGMGGCTEDPCTPDPCVGANEQGCTDVNGVAECGCKDGYVKAFGTCIVDPCKPVAGVAPCVPPGPDKCQAVEGEAVCYCPDGSQESPSGCIETDARAFVTSLKTSSATIAGALTNADQLCQTQAFAAGLSGNFAAWLSLPGQDAGPRFAGGGPWRTWDPEVELWTALVANGKGDLTNGDIGAPIAYDAFGNLASPDCAVWTGTTPGGLAAPPIGPTGGTCQGWTATAAGATGLAGSCHATDAAWTADGPRECTEQLSLYCLQLP